MSDIKTYSSLFATKMNYILDLIDVAPIQHGRAKAIENIVNEPGSTINNWLFNGRLPRDNKKLAISDAVGVSYNYLFDDKINVHDIGKPEIYKDEQCYLVAFIDESEIFNLKTKNIFPIKNRLPIMVPNFDTFVKKYGTKIFITKFNNSIFEPHVQNNSSVIYAENVILEDFKLVIHKNNKSNQLIVKRIVEENGQFFLESIDSKKQLVREPVNRNDDLVSIVFTYSNS